MTKIALGSNKQTEDLRLLINELEKKLTILE